MEKDPRVHGKKEGTVKKARSLGAAAVCAAALLAPAAPAAAEDPVVGEVLAILKERGLVDEARYKELVAKNQAYEEEHQSLLGRIEWSGDVRGRLENFWYDEDELGGDRADRTRARVRLRLQGKARINEHIDAVFRLASGDEGEHRSTNRTLGANDDFALDPIFIDRAYLALHAPGAWLPETAELDLTFGKVPNPFLWKAGKDYMLWDHDINPEGVAVHFGLEPVDGLSLFANAGYMIADENSQAKDPHLLGLQGGAIVAASEAVELGARVSWYDWSSVDTPFVARVSGQGGTVRASGLSDSFSTGELAAYVRFSGIENWPVLLYGHFAHNFAGTEVVPGSAGEDDGWGVGVEVGDKKKLVMLGVGYYQLEANFWPAQFTDSDLFDGLTNRKGWTVYGGRQILPNTDLNVTLFVSDELESRIPVYATSLRNADRVRLQTDLVVKF